MIDVAVADGCSSAWTQDGQGYLWGSNIAKPTRINLRDPTARICKISLSPNVVGALTTDGRLWTRGNRAELLGHG